MFLLVQSASPRFSCAASRTGRTFQWHQELPPSPSVFSQACLVRPFNHVSKGLLPRVTLHPKGDHTIKFGAWLREASYTPHATYQRNKRLALTKRAEPLCLESATMVSNGVLGAKVQGNTRHGEFLHEPPKVAARESKCRPCSSRPKRSSNLEENSPGSSSPAARPVRLWKLELPSRVWFESQVVLAAKNRSTSSTKPVPHTREEQFAMRSPSSVPYGVMSGRPTRLDHKRSGSPHPDMIEKKVRKPAGRSSENVQNQKRAPWSRVSAWNRFAI